MTPREASACCRPVDALLDPGVFQALADPSRVRILACLVKCGRACGVGEVAECCSVDLSVVSRHLQALARAGFLTPARAGRTVSYSVRYAETCRTLRRLADSIEACAPAETRRRAGRSSRTACKDGRCGRC